MSPRVTLTVTEGKLAGTEFVLDRPLAWLVGRAGDCQLRLPDDGEHLTVSRRHCLLVVDPPDVRVRDCGSRNGTYVNPIFPRWRPWGLGGDSSG
jgi:eukaryotic-like serine/threonine-protein kinase